MRWCAVVVAAVLSAPTSHAQAPPRNQIGPLQRDAEGHIVRKAAPPTSEATPAPAQSTPPPAGPAQVPSAPAAAATSSAPRSSSAPRPAAAVPPRAPVRLQCPAGSLTCVELVSEASEAQAHVPVTIGQAFRRGDVPKGRSVVAHAGGAALPLQLDGVALHADGSLRFAILTTIVPSLPAGGRVVVGFAADQPAPSAAAAPSPLERAGKLAIELSVYAPQVSAIEFGDFKGHTPGTPFRAGERIVVVIGADAADRYALEVPAALAAGDFASVSKLADALAQVINAKGRFQAFRPPDTFGLLWITTAKAGLKPFELRVEYAGAARVQASIKDAFVPARRFTAAVGALASSKRSWLRGPLATEEVVTGPFIDAETNAPHPHLSARIAVRGFAGSPALRADVAVENDWAYERDPRPFTYDVVIRDDDRTLFRQERLVHAPSARWHQDLWLSGAPHVEVRHDTAYLLGTGAVPHYDLGAAPSEAALRAAAEQIAKADFRPMGLGTVAPYMPTTGGRPDIGPLPRWTAMYLLGMDPRLRRETFGNAAAGAGAPVHYRDRKTGLPVLLDARPGIALAARKTGGPDVLPEPPAGSSVWTVDPAHQPSLSYVPYLMTGDLFYLEELQFWANWNLIQMNPNFRGGAAGLIWADQLRGQAWTLRTLGQAAFVTPDGDPLKAYFAQKLDNNLAWYLKHYVEAPPSGLHWLTASDKPDEVSPWQNDMMTIVLGQLIDMGFPKAEPLMRWMAEFVLGRWTAESAGYCYAMAPGYWLKIRAQPKAPAFDNWRDFFAANWPDVKQCPAPETMRAKDTPSDYPALGRAALAVLAAHEVAGARAAFDRLSALSPKMVAGFRDDPTWAIVP